MKFDLAKEMFKNLEKIKKYSSGYKKDYKEDLKEEAFRNIPEGKLMVDQISKSFEDNFNTNIEALHAYKRRKQTYAKIEKIDQLEDKVKSIEIKIDEVLTTLKKVL